LRIFVEGRASDVLDSVAEDSVRITLGVIGEQRKEKNMMNKVRSESDALRCSGAAESPVSMTPSAQGTAVLRKVLKQLESLQDAARTERAQACTDCEVIREAYWSGKANGLAAAYVRLVAALEDPTGHAEVTKTTSDAVP
jgi:hypothetical protein